MRLIDHLRTADITVAAFAEEIGEAENTVRKIVYGQRQPSLPLAVKIAAATDGAVTEADLILPKAAA
ncbi:helix-turn-helix domain-containing protein [Sphingobium yanoikuyae]|nr:helix-turn-helix transcriptional regulator [Sphingobium yanoikuyae]